MPVPDPTADELVSLLKRSQLKTIIVEGKDDAFVYRWIEKKLGVVGIDILPCSGRNTLLELFRRREEFKHIKTIFIADKDMWLFTEVPYDYRNVIWTTGYSIENDIFASSEEFIDRLMDDKEKELKNKLIELLCLWFASEVEKFRRNESFSFKHHINFIFNSDKTGLNPEFLSQIGYIEPSQETIAEIINGYKLKVRGKNIFDIISHIFNEKERKSKFSRENIFEICLKLGFSEGSYTKKLLDEIESSLVS